jgi:Holliday junction resolvase
MWSFSLLVSLVAYVLKSFLICHHATPTCFLKNSRIPKHQPNFRFLSFAQYFLFSPPFKLDLSQTEEEAAVKEVDKVKLRRWRKRGFYSETVLVKLLQKKGYSAVRVPVSNPSLNPLPDIMARKGEHTYAFEVKNASYYAYFPKQQIDKLFRFLNELIPGSNENKHAVVAAHLGKKWLFKEISWADWEKDKLPDKVRILKRDRGNLNLDKSY